MNNRLIQTEKRKEFFDVVARTLQNQPVEIEIAGLDIGDQIEASWSPLDGISYDPKENILFINTKDFEHSIEKPDQVVSVEENGRIKSIYIKDSLGLVQAVTFRSPLMLESPERFHNI